MSDSKPHRKWKPLAVDTRLPSHWNGNTLDLFAPDPASSQPGLFPGAMATTQAVGRCRQAARGRRQLHPVRRGCAAAGVSLAEPSRFWWPGVSIAR